MRLARILTEAHNDVLIKEFVKFVVRETGLTKLPRKITFVNDGFAAENLTFGTYNLSNDAIVVCRGSRHIVDVLRTLAHEMVHLKQKQDGKDLNGADGSETENEANASAGTLMRKFRTLYPEMFTHGKTK